MRAEGGKAACLEVLVELREAGLQRAPLNADT